MSFLTHLSPGKNPPHDIHVVIEIPALSAPIKYEIDKESGALFVDRFLTTAMQYPCNYGFIPNTLSEDGDPTDVLVLTPFPLAYTSVIRARPIGMLAMEDESGIDAKILALPISKLYKGYDKIQSPSDLPAGFQQSIQHFFEHYKDLEVGKWVKVREWHPVEVAHREILASIERAR